MGYKMMLRLIVMPVFFQMTSTLCTKLVKQNIIKYIEVLRISRYIFKLGAKGRR